MNLRRHWERQLKRVEQSIESFESQEKAGPLLDEDGFRLTCSHLHATRDGLRRELGIAPSAAERRERL